MKLQYCLNKIPNNLINQNTKNKIIKSFTSIDVETDNWMIYTDRIEQFVQIYNQEKNELCINIYFDGSIDIHR